jgi:uncharacterized protein (TIRG00374 family)
MTTDPEKKKKLKTKIKDIVFFIIRIAIAVGIIGWLVSKNYEGLVKALKGFNYYWLIPAAVLYGLHLCAGAWRWWLLLHVQDVKISFFETLSLTLQGFFFSLVLPGGSLGGDVVKAAFIAKRAPEGKKLTGAFTILIDRVLGMIALFSLAGIAGIISYRFLSGVSGVMEVILYSLLFGCFTGLIASIVIFFHRQLEKIKLIKWCLNLADKLAKGAIHRLMEAMDSFRNAWPTLIKIILISVFCIHLVLSLVVYFIARGLDSPSVDPEIYVLGTTLGNAAGSIPMTPSGTGTRDAVIEKVFKAAFIKNDPNLNPENAGGLALAIALMFTAVVLVFNLFGGLFFIFDKFIRKKECSST